MGTNSDSCS